MKTNALTRIPSSRAWRFWSTAFLVNLFLPLTLWAQEPTRPFRPHKALRASRVTQPAALPLTRDEITEAEFQLAHLGYWLNRADGVWDESSRHALIAFQKVEKLQVTGKLTRADYENIMLARRPESREAGPAHVEIDLRRQVLFVVDAQARVNRILPVSSGSGEEFTSEGWTRDAITPPGRFNVERKIEGWRKSPLGMIYYPNYIFLGIAIHGSASVPTKPASHGCIRVPMFAAAELYKLLPKGTPVVVYDGLNPFPSFHLFPPVRPRPYDVKASN